MDQVLRSFLLALTTITAVFVLFMVMAEATRSGLSPQDIGTVLPYMIPGTLPYTVPVALLFAVSVVYGRLASDNEIVAVKTAGLSAMSMINPSLLLAFGVSGLLWFLCGDIIPRANHTFKKTLLGNLEEAFYKFLKKQHEFDRPDWPFFIRVRDVEGKTMIDPTFKRRVRGTNNPDVFDLVIQARRARIEFRSEERRAIVTLEDARTEGGLREPVLFLIDGQQRFEYPIPPPKKGALEKRVQEMTDAELDAGMAENLAKIRLERKRQAVAAAMRFASGRIVRTEGIGPSWKVEGIDWPGLREAFSQFAYWKLHYNEYRTEKNMRRALACGPFFFVLLGAPVGILFARRDFLSAFISCFLPIILIYYPLLLAAVNMGKQGMLRPEFVWGSNAVLFLLAWRLALPPVRRH
ncbi:MAG: LptF/LptG family permease [Isosphaeraceae bacterium]|nr:LptF/LptG family permease [Isosphaeraceae bacterium]